jgi:hypothetical protein
MAMAFRNRIVLFLLIAVSHFTSCELNTNKEREMETGKVDKFVYYENLGQGVELISPKDSSTESYLIHFKNIEFLLVRTTEINKEITTQSFVIQPTANVYVMDGCSENIFPLGQGAILSDHYNWVATATKLLVSEHLHSSSSGQDEFRGQVFDKQYLGFRFMENSLYKYAWIWLTNDTLSTKILGYAYQK